VNLVRVDVYPTTKNGPVLDLQKNDFEVYEDGVLQRVETFEHIVARSLIPEGERSEPRSEEAMNDAAADPHERPGAEHVVGQRGITVVRSPSRGPEGAGCIGPGVSCDEHDRAVDPAQPGIGVRGGGAHDLAAHRGVDACGAERAGHRDHVLEHELVGDPGVAPQTPQAREVAMTGVDPRELRAEQGQEIVAAVGQAVDIERVAHRVPRDGTAIVVEHRRPQQEPRGR
jgi:hypothetical protein